MIKSSNINGNGTNQPKFDRAYRINELNKIEQNIAKMLRMAGEAVKALTLQVDQTNGTDDSIEQRKKTFAKATSDYFGALSYVDIHLRREIYALEEANIIPADIPKDTGATGNLDIGWLNSRNDKVGTDMRAELWSQAKEILDVINLDEIFKKTNQSNETISE